MAPAVFVFVVIAVIGMRLGHNVAPDSDSYVAMAQGHFERAAEPFSGRILHPALAGLLARVTRFPVETTFCWIALASLATVLAVNWWLLSRASGWPRFLPAFSLFLLPWLVSIYGVYTIQDMFYAALLSLFCAELIRREGRISVISLAILLLLYLVRESTVLMSIALIAVAFPGRKYWRIAAIAAVSIAGLVVSKHFEAMGVPNQHGVSGLTYLAMKVLYNPPQNMLGMKLLVDSYQYYDPVHAQRIFELPFAVGRIRHVAFYGFEPSVPLTMLMTYLCSFGLIPVFIAASVRERVLATRGERLRKKHAQAEAPAPPFWPRLHEIFNKPPEAIRVLLVFGILCAVSTPFLGNAVNRYLAYGWPAFTICLPYLGIRGGSVKRIWLITLHYAMASILALQYWSPLGATDWWPAVGAGLAVTISVGVYVAIAKRDASVAPAWATEANPATVC